MDILGVSILALTTAVGGGIIRDIVLGITPPRTFQTPVYALIAISAGIIIFIPIIHRWFMQNIRLFERILIIMDALGLGIFTVIGIRTAFEVSHDFNGFLLVFVGVITGVGGGILRDIFAGDTPYIFVKDIYASASIIGAIACVVFWQTLGEVNAMLAGMIIIFVIRILSVRFNLNLPHAKGFEQITNKSNNNG